jgi:hypothetical protein
MRGRRVLDMNISFVGTMPSEPAIAFVTDADAPTGSATR